MSEVEETFRRWNAYMIERGLKVNTGKTKLLVTEDIQTEQVQFGVLG